MIKANDRYSWTLNSTFSLFFVCAQLCLTLCNLMDCSPSGSSVHGIFQARTLEQDAIFYSKGSSRPRDQTHVSWVSCIGRQVLYHCATWEALSHFQDLEHQRDFQEVANLCQWGTFYTKTPMNGIFCQLCSRLIMSLGTNLCDLLVSILIISDVLLLLWIFFFFFLKSK